MTLTVTEYRHDDASAPVLDGSIGSLITVLQKCLVDGYGDKDPAGWTKPLSDLGRAAFVNNTTDGGTGCYVYVDDNAPSAEGARAASIRTYTTMTDIDTGDYGTNLVWCRKSNTADSTPRPWVLWADGITFWLYIDDGSGASNASNFQFAGAGDYECHDADNAYRFFALGRNAATTSGLQEFASCRDAECRGLEVVRLDGLSGAATGQVLVKSSQGLGAGNCGGRAQSPGLLGGAFFAPVDIVLWREMPLGRLRGVKTPMHRLEDTYTAGEEMENSGLIFTLVNTEGDINFSENITYGALPVDRIGPW